jgi:hypothetical protein
MKRGELNMRNVKKGYRNVLLCIILLLSLVFEKTLVVQASTNYVTRGYFIKLVCQEIGITAKGTTNQAYINSAIEHGIITKSTFSDYERNVTKVDAAVILVNAHESLYGNTISEDLIQTIIEKRITDVNKIPDYRRISFAKAYAYGYIKGSSDGSYTTSRTFNPTQKISKDTALSFISMLKNESKRCKITEDGQLIRKTDLPKFAEFYPYILASYPNEFYDWEFQFMKACRTRYKDGKQYYEYFYETGEYKDGIDYAFPATVKNYKNTSFSFILPDGTKIGFGEAIDYNWTIWEKNVKDYLWNVFNVDYRTLDKNKQWYNAVITTSSNYEKNKVYLENYVQEYIKLAKKNKTIIECDKIAVDKSGIYKDTTGTYIRVYAHYRINSSLDNNKQYLSPLAFTFKSTPNYSNIKLGQWRDGYFDIEILMNGSISEAIFSDYFRNVNVLEW